MLVLACFRHKEVGHLLAHLHRIRAMRDVQEAGPLKCILLRVPLSGSDGVLQQAIPAAVVQPYNRWWYIQCQVGSEE